VVTTIAAVADTAEDQFIAYYDRFMPCLKVNSMIRGTLNG
jgi:hypothetical protein